MGVFPLLKSSLLKVELQEGRQVFESALSHPEQSAMFHGICGVLSSASVCSSLIWGNQGHGAQESKE